MRFRTETPAAARTYAVERQFYHTGNRTETVSHTCEQGKRTTTTLLCTNRPTCTLISALVGLWYHGMSWMKDLGEAGSVSTSLVSSLGITSHSQSRELEETIKTSSPGTHVP